MSKSKRYHNIGEICQNLTMKQILKILWFEIVIFDACMGSELSDKAAYIANKEFEYVQVTCVVWEKSDSDDINAFLQNYRGTTATFQAGLATNPIELRKFAQYKQTVLFATSPDELNFFLNIMKDKIVSTIRIILIVTEPVNSDTELSQFTKIAWENDIGYLVILSINKLNKGVTVASYFPFREGICNNYKPITLSDNESKYFRRNFANFQKCPVRFTALHFPPFFMFDSDNGTVTHVGGIDGEVLKLLLERLNASMKIVSSTDHGGIGKFINGTFTGSFGDLVNGIADTMALAIILSYDRYKVAQYTYVYTTLDVMWCAPNRREIGAWAKVLLPFFTSITPFLVLSFGVVIASVMLAQRYGAVAIKIRSTFMNVVYQTLGLFLGQTIEVMTDYWLINSVFTLWIWFCLIVRVVYQSNLVEGFQRIILEPHLSTVEEGLKAVDGYGGVPGFLEFYKNTSIEKNYKQVSLDEMPIYIKEIAGGRRFLLTVDALLVQYLSQTVQFLDERVTRIPVCFFTRPRWPAADEFNKIIEHVAEAGFVAKIFRDHTTLWLSHSNFTTVESVKPIDFSTLSACFYGLIVMCCICTIIFVFEIIYYKYKTTQKA